MWVVRGEMEWTRAFPNTGRPHNSILRSTYSGHEATPEDSPAGGRPRTAWMDNVKTWTGLSVEESIRMTEDRDKWRKYVHGVANPRIEDG